ncbi:MAG: twin-arginine translocase TatA/TatE family subunit [Alphaproteobacteria bacterium]|nr:twin-arginine translocase TatA/TatE family subunit [Alphaproteobacteria bacterium]
MGTFSVTHWIILLVIVVLLFGSGRISSVMADVAKGIKSFKKGMADDDEPAKPAEDKKTIDHQGTVAEKTETQTTKAG